MGVQLNLLILLITYTPFGFADLKNEPLCGAAWVGVSSAETDFVQAKKGQIFHQSTDVLGNKTKIKITDFTGNLIDEITIPKIDGSQIEPFGNGLVYLSEKKIYYYDRKQKKSKVIAENASTLGWGCDSDESDTTIYMSCSSNENPTFYDTQSQRSLNLSGKATATASGQTVFYAETTGGSEKFSHISIHDFATSKKQKFPVTKSKEIEFISPNHVSVQDYDDDDHLDTHFVKIDGSWVKFTDTPLRRLNGVLSNGDLIFRNARHKRGLNVPYNYDNADDFVVTTEIFDKTGKTKRATLNGAYGKVVAGGQSIAKYDFKTRTMHNFSEADFQELVSGKNVRPKIESVDSITVISKQGNWGVGSNLKKNETRVTNLNTGKSFKIPFTSQAYDVQEGEDGKNIALRNSSGQRLIVDTTSGRVRRFHDSEYTHFDKNFNLWLVDKYNSDPQQKKEFCFPASIQVIDDDCNCLFKDTEVPISNSTSLEQIQDVAVAALCKEPFKKEDWDKITPPLEKGQISEKQAALYLKRFQKKGGYDPKIHLPILSGLLRSKLVEKAPDLVNETLKSLAYHHPRVLQAAYTVLKLDKNLALKQGATPNSSCRTETELHYNSQMIQKMKLSTQVESSKTTTDDWLVYSPFKKDLQELPKEERDQIVDGVAESLSQNAASSQDLEGAFQSKLYYFAKKHALDLVGVQGKPATDLAIAIRKGANIPILLGSGNLEGATSPQIENVINNSDPFGFKYKVLPALSVNPKTKVGRVFNESFAWKHDDQPYQAHAKITVLEPLDKLISKSKSPNYSQLKKNGTKTGMMVIGTNLAGHAGLVDRYLTYYQNEGFVFDTVTDINIPSFFKEVIQSGEVNYLIKEAHSDGDERNLFRSAKEGRLHRGVLNKPNGEKEVIYLATPKDHNSGSKLISNQEFGSWVRSRGKNQPLIYFNTSCSSTRKVISEIAAARSPNFIPIPGKGSVNTFREVESNGTRQVLHAFRNGKDYDQIRAALHASENYKKGKDQYIFPDEKDYDLYIRENLNLNLDVEMTIKGPTGEVIHIDKSIDN